MRNVTLLSAVLASALALTILSPRARAEPRPPAATMTIKLDSGESATFHVAKVHGKMMAMIPYEEFQSVFGRYMGGPHP
jgi:hypothetical protein